MLARSYSCAVLGLEEVLVEVEVDYGSGLPGITVVGLPDAAVQESREAVRRVSSNYCRTSHKPLQDSPPRIQQGYEGMYNHLSSGREVSDSTSRILTHDSDRLFALKFSQTVMMENSTLNDQHNPLYRHRPVS